MFRSTTRALLATAVLAGTAVVGVSTAQAATPLPQGTVGIQKSVVGLTGAARPGSAFSYQLTASCSSLTVACVGATVSDVLPAGLTVTDPPDTTRSQTVTFNPTTRLLTITFTQPLPAPNPVGSTGLLAGSVSKIYIGVQLPTTTTAADGSVITNTATISATNAAPASDSASVTVTIPRRVTPVATKSWPDGNAIAQSGDQSTVTIGARNSSSRSTQISSLTVSDTTPATFDTHDLVSVGPVVRFPAGANQVSVGVCTQPVGTPCASAQWIVGAPTPGPALTLPAGVNAAAVTGVQFSFSNSAGTPLPIDPTGGQVSFGLALRNTLRSSGATLDPTTTLTNANCAAASAVDPVAGAAVSAPACVNFSVFPRATTLSVAKEFISDPTGNYSASGVAIAGQSSPVSALTQVINTSAFPVRTITITEPSATTASDFSALDVSSIAVQFPAGATTAVVAVSCRNGATIAPVTLAATQTIVRLSSTGCPVASPPAQISVTFTGVTAQGGPAIASGAVARLGVHGTLNSTALAGQLSNCADGVIASAAGGQGSAYGIACANLTVHPPVTIVTGTKSSSATALVPGVPVSFTIRSANAGTLPQASFSITDPPSPTAAGNPFDLLAITHASLTTNPAGLASSLQIQLYDPASSSWVPYDANNAALLTAARGIRVTLVSGVLPAGASVRLIYSAVLRSTAPVRTTVQNCQVTAASSAQSTAAPVQACSNVQTVTPPSTSGAVQKIISPGSVARTLPGVPAQSAQVRLQARNTGNIALRQIVVTDADAAFFDAVNLTSIDAVNFPPGANRVEVDVCTTGCASSTYVNGLAAPTAALPAGVAAADVRGLRFTFTNSAGGYTLTPGSNFPSGGACPSATVCFHVAPRVDLRSDPATPVPGALTNTASAAGESPLQPPGSTYSFGTATAPLQLVQGTPALDVNKTPSNTAAGPGTPIAFTLNVRNTGTAAVPSLVVSDPVPTDLVFDDAYAGTNGLPFTITSTVPAGTPAVPAPTFVATRGDPTQPDRITALRWSFPGFAFLPGSTLAIGYQDTLIPGFSAGQTETNVFGAGSADTLTQQTLVCTNISSRDGQVVGGVYGPGRYCTSAAQVLSRGGTDVDAQKWVSGDASLGFYNTVTNTRVTPGDVACPYFRGTDGRDYTRYPCVAQVLAGENFVFALRVINVGNTPVTEVRLADGLPHVGDTGVKLTGEQRDTEWSARPRLNGAPTLVGPGNAAFSYTSDAQVCTAQLASPPGTCPAGSWNPAYSGDALGFQAFVTFPGYLQPGASFTVSVPMQAPPTLSNPTDSMPIAWNSFAHTDFVLEPGTTVPVQLPLVEPPKVGVALPFGQLQVNKQISGGSGNPAAAGPFEAAYSCTVTPTGGSPVVVAAGTGAFSVAAPLVVAGVPVGARCAVWETVTGGGLSDHTSPATALTVIISATPGLATPVTLVNGFSDVASATIASLTVIKRVVNGGPGPYSFTMACTLAGAPVTLPADTASFTLTSDQTKVFSVPAGAACTVTEVNLPALDTVSYAGSATPVAVTVTGQLSETITNRFPAVAIAPPPPPSTGSTTTPPPPPAAVTNAPPPPPTTQSALASTGSNVRGQLVWVALMWVMGAGLVVAVRRRRPS